MSIHTPNLPRRQFLHLTSITALGSTIIPSWLLQSCMGNGPNLPTISLQLYTLRKEIEKDIAGTLKRVALLGYKNVETAFWPTNITVKQAAGYLKDAGLKVSSAHVALPVGEDKAAFLETAKAMGCKKMIWHGWPEDRRYSSEEGTKELIGLYNEANHFAKSNGLQFGLHNHWWEFRNKIGDRYVYELLLEGLEPDIFFEIDTYWVKVAGHDPAKIVGDFGKRAPLLHIKDGPAVWSEALIKDEPEPMTAVGKGTQDFPAIAKAANGNTEFMVVEMDVTATDVFEAIRDSHRYLLRNKLGKD